MNRYICDGALIRRKNEPSKVGTVYAIDRKCNIVVAQNGNSFWSDKIKNVEVISYKEVK